MNFIIYMATSLDGYIADEEGSVDWLSKYDEINYGYNDFIKKIDCIVMGGTTYRQILTFGDWSYTSQASYVLSSEKSENANVQGFYNNIDNLLDELRAKKYKNIWIMGGAKTCQSFINRGLVNSFDLFLIPDVLGGGIKLFENINDELNLSLKSTKNCGNKIARLTYTIGK